MNHNDWMDIALLEDYLDGKLDARTMHNVEKHALDDPFVAEALAGLSQSRKRTVSLSLLQKQLQERVSQKPVIEKRWRITSQRLSIAAAAAVLFVVVSIFFWMKQTSQKDTLAENKKVEAIIKSQQPVAATKPETPETEKPAEVPLTAKRALPQTRLPKKAASVMVNEPLKARVDDLMNQPVSTAKAHVNNGDTVKVPVAKAALNPEVITIGEAKAARVQTDREVSLQSKAEGVKFAPNTMLKGKPGVLINGVVYEKPGGQPLPGAIVRIPGTDKATTTNAKGEFSLATDSSTQTLSIGYIGFSSKEVQAKDRLSVGLEHDGKALNEVVVTHADRTKVLRPLPTPEGGWAVFSSYLNANNKLSPHGAKKTKDVRLTFDVKKDGTIANIKVVKGLTKAENEEAIRLIKEGPKWTVPTNSKRKAEVVVSF